MQATSKIYHNVPGLSRFFSCPVGEDNFWVSFRFFYLPALKFYGVFCSHILKSPKKENQARLATLRLSEKLIALRP